MTVDYVLDYGAFKPEKGHEDDGGFDLRSPDNFIIPSRGSVNIDTGVHVAIPKHHVGMLKSKSGLNTKFHILSEGVIDCGYTGSIVACLYNHSNRDYAVYKGDKITQIVIMTIADAELREVKKLSETARGNNGFGSTGK